MFCNGRPHNGYAFQEVFDQQVCESVNFARLPVLEAWSTNGRGFQEGIIKHRSVWSRALKDEDWNKTNRTYVISREIIRGNGGFLSSKFVPI